MTLKEEILYWKKERNAVILAHNYVQGELQDLADFTGDSLELSIRAKSVKAPVICCCLRSTSSGWCSTACAMAATPSSPTKITSIISCLPSA